MNGLDLPWIERIFLFYREFDMGLLVWIYHHRGWCWWLMEKNGYIEHSMRNSFHISSNVSYFVYLNLMEDFQQNLPSVSCWSMYLPSIDILVYGELPSLAVWLGRLWTSVFICFRSWMSWYRCGFLWTTTHRWEIFVLISITWVRRN